MSNFNFSELFASSTATSNSRGSITMLQSAVLYSLPYQDTDAWDKKACALVDFYNDHKIVPLPIPKDNKLLLVLKAGNKAKNSYGWLNFLISIGVDIYYGVETGTGDKTKLVGKVFDFRGSDGYINVKGHKSERKTQFAAYDESIPVATKVYTHQMQDVVMGYFASWFTQLDATQQATLFSLLAGGKPELDKTIVSIPKPNGGFTIDFATGVLSINAGSFVVVPNVRLAGVTCSGKTALFLLGLTMSVGSFESYKMKGFINELPNMWEEDPNYGVTVKGDLNDPSVVIPHYSYHKFDVVTKNMGAGISMFPWVTIATPKKKVDMDDVKAALDEEGVITGDKYLLKFFAGKQSANAALIGDGGDYIYTWHDAGKASKLWNRPMQSRKFLKADQYANNSFTTSCRVPSKIGTVLSDGTVVRQSGRMMVVGLSTSGLAMGSGPCILNPSVQFHIGVKKTLGGRVSLHDYSHHAISQLTKAGVKTGLFKAHHAFNFLKSKVAEKVEALLDTGKVYAPGETILEINTLPGTKVIIKNTLANVNVRVVAHDVFSAPVEDGDYTPTYFNVDLTVEVIESTQLVKIRRDFIKATTVPMAHKFYTLDGVEFYPQFAGKDMEIMFNNETIKGRSIHIDAFANSNDGYCLNHPNDANMTWHYDDKVETVNLLDSTNLVSNWVEECVQDVILEINIAQDEWDKLMEAGSLTGIVSVVQHDGYVTVKEKIQLLVCQLPIEVEISTAAESIGASPMTPEMVCGISVQSQKLAAILFEEAKPAQATVLGLVNMITKTIPMTDANAVNLTSAKGREFILSVIGTLDGMDDSHVLKAYKALFNQGVYFVATNGNNTANMFLDFDVIRTSMVWISGSADQISQEIVAFLRAIVNPPESGYDTFFYGKVTQLMASLNGWLKKAFVSKGILKRAARSSKCLVNLKIRTCYYEFLQSDADDLPKAAINPGCDSVMLLAKDATGKYYKKYIEQVVVDNTFSSAVDAVFGIEGINPDDYKPNKYCRLTRMKELKNGGFVLSFFNPYLLDGELVSAFRIPMFMGLGCKLVVTEKVGRSHLFMLPYLWSMANEGDSDGDGVSILNLGIRGLTISDVNEMNDSWVGLKGYKIIYGDNVSKWPYAEFSESPKKKWMKWDTAEDKAKYCKPYVTCIPKYTTTVDGKEVMGYYESGVNVQKHYVAAVGIAYGIASVLTFKLADALYNPEVSAYNIKAMKLAVVIAWRALYEGLGLAGYSNAATKWFAILGASKLSGTYIEKDGKYYYPGHKAVTKNDPVLNAVSTLLYLGEKEEAGNGLSKFWLGKDNADGSNDYYKLMYKAMELIIEAEATRTFYSGLEKGSNVVKVIRTEKQLKECYMFGGLRRMGQGCDPAGINMLEASDQVDIDDEVILPQSLFAGVAQTEAYNGLSNPYLKSLLINGTSIHNNISSYLYDEMKAEEEEYSDYQ